MFTKELKAMIEAGKLACKKILEIYHRDFDVEIKDDNSPVTEADKAADKIIKDYLKYLFPNYSFLTEESDDDLERLNNDYVFIIDPVDGTKDFVKKDDEFATNIALAYQHKVVAGVVFVPARGDYYYAHINKGAFHVNSNGEVKQIHVSDKTEDLTLYISVFHASDIEKDMMKYDARISKIEAHGSSIKGCQIAEGLGEIQYRPYKGTKEWDIAPIDLIVKEAGGFFIQPDGSDFTYNRKDVYNHDGYIIVNRLENIPLIHKK